MAEEEKTATKVPWTSEVNAGKLESFTAEMGNDVPSKGTFAEDYAGFVESTGLVVGCPFFSSTEIGVRIANVAIDLPSWRAMLLAISTAGSPVKELACHGCTLESQHISDLVATLEKMGVMEVVKMDFLTVKLGDEEDLTNTLLPLLSSEKTMINYLSLKGCNLSDSFASSDGLYKNLSENVALTTLNLANNQFTDMGLSSICKALKVSPAITEVSLAQNNAEGDCLMDLVGMLAGVEVSEEEEGVWKNVAKHVGDKNKAVKDANKGRKKKGYSDLPEVATPAERVVKVDDVNCIANRTLKTLDLSFCPLAAPTFEKAMRVLQEQKITEPALDLTLVVRGRSTDLIVPVPTANPDDAAGEEAKGGEGGSIDGVKLCY